VAQVQTEVPQKIFFLKHLIEFTHKATEISGVFFVGSLILDSVSLERVILMFALVCFCGIKPSASRTQGMFSITELYLQLASTLESYIFIFHVSH
jgi:hypothetical protein